ncbi:MAG TPA: dimethyl sulfoxide reductase anchor subunit [Syntrophomonas sp.]|nr:dimethyl sulfoxide reductase anchor subunit [Syntrophomonas sp.]
MLRKEWPLIINTILAQLAAGIFIFISADIIIILQNAPELAAANLKLNGTGLVWAGPIIILAMFLSLFHLGKPFRAYRAMANLPVSWLSWEIFLSGAFLVLWAVTYFIDKPYPYLLGVTSLTALLNVVSMSNIYSSTGRPGWKGAVTYLDFLGSMVIFGSVASAFITNGADDFKTLVNAPIITCMFILAVELIAVLAFVFKQKAAADEFSLDKLACSSDLNEILLNKYLKISVSGWFLTFMGVQVVYLNIHGYINLSWLLPVMLVLAGEVIRRYGFFMLVGESENSAQFISAVSPAEF